MVPQTAVEETKVLFVGASMKIVKKSAFEWFPNASMDFGGLEKLIKDGLLVECDMSEVKMQKVAVIRWKAASEDRRDGQCGELYRHLQSTAMAMSMA